MHTKNKSIRVAWIDNIKLFATKVVKIIENTYLSGVFFYVIALNYSTFDILGVIFG